MGTLLIGDFAVLQVAAPDGTPATADTTTGSQLVSMVVGNEVAFNGAAGTIITRLMVGEGDYFDGDTPDTEALIYDWVGDPGLSVSTESLPVVYGTMGPFPLPDDRHYFAIADASPFVHDGTVYPDEVWVALVQQKVGAPVTGLYDPVTAGLVSSWRQWQGLDEGEHVDETAWTRMDEVLNPAPIEAGG